MKASFRAQVNHRYTKHSSHRTVHINLDSVPLGATQQAFKRGSNTEFSGKILSPKKIASFFFCYDALIFSSAWQSTCFTDFHGWMVATWWGRKTALFRKLGICAMPHHRSCDDHSFKSRTRPVYGRMPSSMGCGRNFFRGVSFYVLPNLLTEKHLPN